MKWLYFLTVCLLGVPSVFADDPQTRNAASEQSESNIWVPVTLEVKPVEGKTFLFGEFNDVAFVLKNVSEWRILVTAINPTVNKGEDIISLYGSVYGSVKKDPEKDAYLFNPMSQQQTREAFYDGLLMPGDSVTVHHVYRPVSRKEEFRITYYILDAEKHASTGEHRGWELLNVYIPETEGSISTMTYTPFEIKKWKILTQENIPIHKTGVGHSYRGVLIPDLFRFSEPDSGWTRTPQHYTKVIPISYDDEVFCMENAYQKIDSIRQNNHVYEAFYCKTLGGYVVLDGYQHETWHHGEYCWVLKDSGQTEKGELLAGFDPALAKEIDSQSSIQVRVSDKQEGLGPNRKEAGWYFWEVYPVIYGDGMYTNGEFIRIKKEQLGDFLKTAYQKGFKLKRRPYFFNSAYYVLEATKRD